jgi:hypothetical protein
MSRNDRLSAQRAVLPTRRRQLFRGIGASISACQAQAAGIEAHRSWAEGGDLKQATDDGYILEEVDHLVGIAELVMKR